MGVGSALLADMSIAADVSIGASSCSIVEVVADFIGVAAKEAETGKGVGIYIRFNIITQQ